MKIQTTNKHQYAYNVLRSRILNGTYSPGHRIVIDQMAKELSLSAIPIREAIRNLEADGLIEYIPYKGAVVTQINENEYVETLTALAVLEGYATSLSSRFIPDEKIAELREINRKMMEEVEQFHFNKFGQLNRSFHNLIFEFCGNRYLKETIYQTQNRLDTIRRTGSAFLPVRPKQSVEEHEQLINMIAEKQKLEVIENFARSHKMNTAESFKKRKNDLQHDES
ncbi:MAG: GntR family transcriptional regulator [Tuberibacillus sp.]